MTPSLVSKRIGVIVPSINTCVEPQFRVLTPAGAEFYVTRARLRSGTRSELLALGEAAVAGAELLADLGPDLVLFQCTAGTTIGGPAYERDLVGRIAAAAGCPAASTGGAVVAAFRTLGVRHVALISPYQPEVNAAEAEFLDAHGIRVVEDRPLAMRDADFPLPSPDDWRRHALDAATQAADAVFLSCANIRSLDAVAPLERELGKPVVTSNQAGAWYALRLAGLDVPIAGQGALLARPLVDPSPGVAPA